MSSTKKFPTPSDAFSLRTPAARTSVPAPATTPSSLIYRTYPPRVGGVLPDGDVGEAWTGGSNITVSTSPTHLTQRRPYKYSASQSLLNKIEAGLSEKLGSSGEDSSCTFEHWMRLQSNAHVKFGLDTVFRIPNSDWTTETFLFNCYHKRWSEVKPWVDSLQSGIIHPQKGHLPPCTYDRQNLEYSATFLKASLTPKFRTELEIAIGLDATGPQVLISIIERKLSLQASLQRELISNLEKLNLTSEPGENIPNFNAKVKDLCEAIEKCGPAPLDINLIVMRRFVNCSVSIFAQHVNTKYFDCRTDPQKYPWHNTLELHASMYYQLKDMWTPEASRPITNQEFQNFVKSTKSNMNKLQISDKSKGNKKTDPKSLTAPKQKKC